MLIFLQARSNSSRFPKKVMAPLLGMPMILFQIQRVLLAKFDFRLVVLTSSEQSDDELSSILQNAGIEVFRGDLIDVNLRFRQALEYLEVNQGHFIRITADCPLLCLDLLEFGLEEVILHEWDYFSNTVIRTFPDGLDFEIVSIPRFIEQDRSKFDQYDREHVTPYFYRNSSKYSIGQLVSKYDYSRIRLTVDYPSDLEMVSKIVNLDSFDSNNTAYSHLINLYNKVNGLREGSQLKHSMDAKVERYSNGEA